jgi:PAS domain S-box-containing protein
VSTARYDRTLTSDAAPALRLPVAFICLYSLVALAVIPFARTPGPEIPGITTLFVAVVFTTELSTSFLLLAWFRRMPDWPLLILGAAYLYAALMLVAHLLMFPGAIVAGKPLVAVSQQSTGWIFVLWVLGFAFLTLVAVLIEASGAQRMADRNAGRAVALTCGAVVLLVLSCVWVATAMADRLPPLVSGTRWTATNQIVIFLALAMVVCSISIILASIRTPVFLWLSLALTVVAFANILSEAGGARYSVGWTFGRVSWILSSCVLFLYFLQQSAWQQVLLTQRDALLGQRTLERDRIWNVSEDLLGVSNPAGYFTSINPSWEKVLGWTEEELRSMHESELRHPDDAPAAVAARARLAQGIPTVRIESRFRHRDGSWRWIAWTLSAENDLIYLSGRHVTPERTTAEALQLSERQFRMLVQGVKDYAIYMLDRDGRVTSWNSGAQNLEGYGAEEVIGQHFSRFYTEEERISGSPERDLRQAEHEGRYEAEGWRVCKDGSRFWASVLIDAIQDPATGKLVGFAKVTRDITEQHNAKDASGAAPRKDH